MAADAKIGLVCPAYNYPGFLPELAASILAQNTVVPFRAVFVDDCCPDPETVELCSEYACAYPDVFSYIRLQINGGLSAARNIGVDKLLSAFPEIEGITFLDADDRVYPVFVQRCYEALGRAFELHKDSTTLVGWVFEDPNMIGIPGTMRRLRTHSLLWNMVGATQTSSSIFNADVFRSGLRYAEDMRHGGEDWEFSLRAYKSGFRAYYQPHLGLRYRRRPGSMSAALAGNAAHERNRADIRLRHPDLYCASTVLKKYAEECAHYCIINESQEIRVTSSIEDDEAPISLESLIGRLINNLHIPGIPAPQIFIFAHSSFLRELKRNRRLLDFAVRANLAGTETSLWHQARPFDQAFPPRENISFQQVTSALNIDRSNLCALTMTIDQFLSAVNSRQPFEYTYGHTVLDWEFPNFESPIWPCADDIIRKVIDDVRRLCLGRIGRMARYQEHSWRPMGLSWRDLPAHLSGLDAAFPEARHLDETLIVVSGADMTRLSHQAELVEMADEIFAATNVSLSLAIIGEAPTSIIMKPSFSNIFLLPVKQGGKNAISVASFFGSIIFFGVSRLSDHSPALQKNKISLFFCMFKNEKDFARGRAIGHLFKSFNGFISEDTQQRSWLTAHGVPKELIFERQDLRRLLKRN